jgi:nitrate/TMAO reductase-like tetraheme cytochrome c subunit
MKRVVALFAAAALCLVALAGLASAAEHQAVGVAKCKMCHKIEFESWSKTKHATAKPVVECETCHGNGGDFWKMSVMKDPAAAKAAGLIAKPTKASCTAKCHKPAEFKDEMLTKVHDNKPKK